MPLSQCATDTFGTVPCWWLAAASCALGVAWALTAQLAVNLAVCRMLAKRADGAASGVGAMAQQLSELAAYSIMLATSGYFVTRSPCFLERGGPGCWPAAIGGVYRLSEGNLITYAVQLAAYSSMIVSERLLAVIVGDSVRPGVDTCLHHALTLALLFGSIGQFSAIGSLVPLTHDASTVPLKLARILQLATWTRGSQIAFATFALCFLLARLLAFPYLVLQPSYLHGVALHAAGDATAAPVAILTSLLGLLGVLNCVWFYKILRLLLTGGRKSGTSGKAPAQPPPAEMIAAPPPVTTLEVHRARHAWWNVSALLLVNGSNLAWACARASGGDAATGRMWHEACVVLMVVYQAIESAIDVRWPHVTANVRAALTHHVITAAGVLYLRQLAAACARPERHLDGSLHELILAGELQNLPRMLCRVTTRGTRSHTICTRLSDAMLLLRLAWWPLIVPRGYYGMWREGEPLHAMLAGAPLVVGHYVVYAQQLRLFARDLQKLLGAAQTALGLARRPKEE